MEYPSDISVNTLENKLIQQASPCYIDTYYCYSDNFLCRKFSRISLFCYCYFYFYYENKKNNMCQCDTDKYYCYCDGEDKLLNTLNTIGIKNLKISQILPNMYDDDDYFKQDIYIKCKNFLNHAVNLGHLKILKWFKQQNIYLWNRYIKNIIYTADYINRLDVFKWLINDNVINDTFCIVTNNIHSISYIFESNKLDLIIHDSIRNFEKIKRMKILISGVF